MPSDAATNQNTPHIDTFKLKVYIINDSRIKSLLVHPNLLISQLFEDLMVRHLKIPKGSRSMHYFALSVRHNSKHQNIFSAQERWLHFSKTLQQENVNDECILFLKVKHWKMPADLGAEGGVAEQLMALQIHTSVTQEYYPCPEKIAAKLAALRIQQHFGDFQERKHHVGFLNRVGLSEYLPSTVSRHNYAYWQERLFRIYKSFKGMSKREAMLQYVNTARKIPYYGMTFFDVLDEKSNAFLLSIAEDGLFIFSCDTLSLKLYLPFVKLRTWAKTLEGFEIAYEVDGRTMTSEFLVDTVKKLTITDLLNEYFYLLPEREKHPDTKPSGIPSIMAKPEDYGPVIQRTVLTRFTSRLEYLKAFYMEICASANMHPVRSFCVQMDEAIDEERDCSILDLSMTRIHEKTLIIITKAIVGAFKYEPEPIASLQTEIKSDLPPQKNEETTTGLSYWKEDLNVEEFHLAGRIPHSCIKYLNLLLTHFKNLRILNISGVCLENVGAKLIATTIAEMPQLEKMLLRDTSVGNKGFAALIDATKDKDAFQSVDASNNRIGDTNLISFLPGYIRENISFVELKLANNKITGRGFEFLVKAICSSQTFLSLDISSNPLTNRGCKELSRLIKNSLSIRHLTYRKNRMMGDALLKVARALRSNKSLLSLDLSDTYSSMKLDSSFSSELCKFLLESHCRLREFRIANNSYGIHFAEEMGTVLQDNHSLKILDMSNSGMCSSIGDLPKQWKEVLAKNTTLKTLHLCRNNIGGLGFRTIFRSLMKNRSIMELHASHNTIPGQLANDLGDFIQNTFVERLNLRSCHLTEDHLKSILTGYSQSRYLRYLDLRDNSFSEEKFGAIIREVMRQKKSQRGLQEDSTTKENSETPSEQQSEKKYLYSEVSITDKLKFDAFQSLFIEIKKHGSFS